MPRTRIKICGVRDLRTIEAASAAGADAVGLDLRPGARCGIDPATASDLLAALPPLLHAVAVYQDPTLEDFLDAEAVCPAPYTQLHGTEKDNLVRRIGPDAIKALPIDPDDLASLDATLRHYSTIEEVCAVLLEAPAGCNWQDLAPRLARSILLTPLPVMLAGGLTPENVAGVVRAAKPWGVSVSAGVENASGTKCPQRIEAFCRAVQQADHERLA
ncbi:MAG: N-(5'-phosphoribosyl)anthranilate isomerase [Phycisphaerales bacterium]|nr:MAG: N-(5'-phosphoribosyl)anthranilate isomerase [Phycisphaerales bacterium]